MSYPSDSKAEFNRRQYEVIAKALNMAYQEAKLYHKDLSPIMSCIEHFVSVLHADNPNFNIRKFHEDCTTTVPKSFHH